SGGRAVTGVTARLAFPPVARPREGINAFTATAGSHSGRLTQSCSQYSRRQGPRLLVAFGAGEPLESKMAVWPAPTLSDPLGHGHGLAFLLGCPPLTFLADTSGS
ncbi:MAG: hypothetical protein LJE95_12205, partial [Acidobacteria bacterium]|nr:hypothetical protein [Acidobacteriota bacterium]